MYLRNGDPPIEAEPEGRVAETGRELEFGAEGRGSELGEMGGALELVEALESQLDAAELRAVCAQLYGLLLTAYLSAVGGAWREWSL
eukprot:906936-Pleurochrysis_carterae.AAC.1